MIISTVVCSELISPNYGNISCSLEDDGVPSYEDTCSFTCNTGYKLTGSDTRTCQSNGSWSGSDDIQCQTLSNGKITSCSSGRVGVGYEGDSCRFTCNTGYELTGSDTRTCQSNGSWNGSTTMCIEGMFPYNIVLLYSGECRIFERGFLVIMK